MDYTDLIVQTCRTFKLEPTVIVAQVQVESGGDTYAWNPEPRYHWLWDVKQNKPFRAVTLNEMASETPPKDFPCLAGDPDQEWWAQQCSWGLLQVMGALAREMGFKGVYLTELCDPVVGLTLGCKHLSELLAWAKGDIEQALAAYNGGKGGNEKAPFRNRDYAIKVLSLRR